MHQTPAKKNELQQSNRRKKTVGSAERYILFGQIIFSILLIVM